MVFRSLVLFSLLLSPPLAAEIKVTITPPELQNVGSVLKDLVSQGQIDALLSGSLTDLEAEASRTIEGALAKPGVYAGLSDAATLPLLALTRPVWAAKRLSFVLGSWAGVQTDTLDTKVWSQRASTLKPDEDYRFGASFQPLAGGIVFTPFPGEWQWSAGGFAALSQVSYTPVNLINGAWGGLFATQWMPRGASWGGIDWQGAALSIGAGWAQNHYTTALTVALPPRTVVMDLTYFEDVVTVETEPTVGVTLDNRGVFVPIQLSTEWSFLKTLRLGVAAGISWSQGWATVRLDGTNLVKLTSRNGLLSRFVADKAYVAVNGSVGGEVGPWWQGFVGATPSLAVGTWRVGLPLTWRYPGGLGGALAWGLAL